MTQLPILAIDEFQGTSDSDQFYSNVFPEHIHEHHQKINKPHKHNFYLVMLFTEGSGMHEIDFERFEIKPGSLFLLCPGKMHNWELSDDIKGYIFFHSKEFYDLNFSSKRVDNYPFYYSAQNSPVIYLEGSKLLEMENLFANVQQEYEGEVFMQQQKLLALIDLIYIELSRVFWDRSIPIQASYSGYAIKLRKLENLIDQHFIAEKSPAKYAEMMHISLKHLNRICKSLIGKTVTDLILDRVILEAKRMLIHTESTVSEVAVELGYTDYSYFSRLFKKRYGASPNSFKREYL